MKAAGPGNSSKESAIKESKEMCCFYFRDHYGKTITLTEKNNKARHVWDVGL